jgi:fatty acid desaturase
MVVVTGLLVANWMQPTWNAWLWLALCAMSVPVSVIAHNHNHLTIWRSRALNTLQDYWLTVFYGFPVFGWIPTHNLNHHKLNNREGDYTITYRLSEKNHLLTLLTYPTLSAIYQQKPISDFLRRARQRSPKRFAYYVSQYAVLLAWVGVALWLDWQKALLYVIVPQQFATATVLVFNYIQHVHADEESDTDHSRNFTSPVLNAFLFNNGFHTVHHDQPGLHWSLAPAAHARVAHTIDPSLIERSFFWFMLRNYLLGPMFPSLQTSSMRLARKAGLRGPGRAAGSADATPAQAASA